MSVQFALGKRTLAHSLAHRWKASKPQNAVSELDLRACESATYILLCWPEESGNHERQGKRDQLNFRPDCAGIHASSR